MKYINKILFVAFGLVLFAACNEEGEYEHPIVQDNKPEVPVLFPGATTVGANPYYSVTVSGGTMNLVVSIPDDSERNIKEITKMIMGATGITPGNVTTASVANFLTSPIAVNGKSVTIPVTIAEWNAFNTNANDLTVPPATGPTVPATGFAERAIMFLITLDDDTTIIPQQLRIRVSR
jgi:hypothetical protein